MKVLAITLGDTNGIGPEIALKAALRRRWPADLKIMLVGDARVLRQQAEAFGFNPPPLCSPEAVRSSRRKIHMWDPGLETPLKWQTGKIVPAASRAAMGWIRETVHLCLNETFDAMVTAPICKEGLQAAGLKMPGHTEYLAELTRTKRFAMMLMGGGLRVVLATRHVPLRDVPNTLTGRAICEAIEMLSEGLDWLGFHRPRLGVCGLNPHAGDGGALGDEEGRMIRPSVLRARKKGVNAAGPIPSDVIFYQALNGVFDGVVAMYHDQGLGPLKMLAFDQGINLTLGLPIIRTSPDHGTAFDIAGKGDASPSSMVEAMKLAYSLSERKNPWRR